MRKVALIIALAALSWAVLGETYPFDSGELAVDWIDNGETLSLHLLINEDPNAETIGNHTWVITSLANRFEDGVFAWQLHFNEEHRSVIVLPSDFLTAAAFSFEQLGITALTDQIGKEILLRIPCNEAVPNLIVPGDILTIHALWLQQTPILTLALTAAGAAELSGEGGPVGAGKIIEASPTTAKLPEQLTIAHGTILRHRFYLLDPESGDNIAWAVIGCNLLRVHQDADDEFVRFLNALYDPETQTYGYEIDTANLAPGTYRLIVWSLMFDGPEEATLIIKE